MKNEKTFVIYTIIVFIFSLVLLNIGFIFYLYIATLSINIPEKTFLTDLLKNFFLWEFLFVTSLSFLFFSLYKRYENFRKKTSSIAENILCSLEHRFGNFLSVQKINLSLIKESREIVERLKRNVEALEGDFSQIIVCLQHLSSEEIENVSNPLQIIENTLANYQKAYPEKKVKIRICKHINFVSDILLITFLDLLLGNAFKYALNKIQIRFGCFKGVPYLAIKNDLSPKRIPGSGLGHKIVSVLAQEEGLVFLKRETEKFYLVLLYKPEKFSRFFHVTFFKRNR